MLLLLLLLSRHEGVVHDALGQAVQPLADVVREVDLVLGRGDVLVVGQARFHLLCSTGTRSLLLLLTRVEGLDDADTQDEAELLFTGAAALSSPRPRFTLSLGIFLLAPAS